MTKTSIHKQLRSLLHQITTSIAFYPSIIALLWVVFAIISLRVEQTGFSQRLQESLPFLVVNEPDTALTILSTFIGGLLSLTVFSFSMVMILLNQASARFSPRLLPGLTTDKTNQIVLGIYIGTIIYCTIILRNVQPDSSYFQIPGFSILLAILSALLCIALFVFFIHNISLKIRIEHILEEIYKKASKIIDVVHKEQEDGVDLHNLPELEHSITIGKNQSGYFENFQFSNESSEFSEKCVLEIIPSKGVFVLPNQQVLKTNIKVGEELKKNFQEAFNLEATPYDMTNFENGFQQVTEIIVKAMSPSTNDPGTANDAIDTLTKLLGKRLLLIDRWAAKQKAGELIIIRKVKSYEDLLFEIMAPLRQYCKADVSVVIKLIKMLSYLDRHEKANQNLQEIIQQELDTLMQDAATALDSERDRKVIQQIRDQLSLD